MDKILVKQVSSLEKIFDKNDEVNSFDEIYVLGEEEFSYQIMVVGEDSDFCKRETIKLSYESDMSADVTFSLVKKVPVEMPVYPGKVDDNYISDRPGLYPDVLIPIENKCFELSQGLLYTVWVNVKPKKDNKVCKSFVSVIIEDECGTKVRTTLYVNISKEKLSEQDLIFTQWLHLDCIADVHGVKVFSKKHWDLINEYIKTASKNGINMILTSIFTPPIDTECGKERKCVQLTEVFCDRDENEYSFDFSKLEKFIKICLKNKIKYFEISHLFTQWGAESTPNIMAYKDGIYQRIFGWDVKSDSVRYKNFLKCFLPQLVDFFERYGLEDKIFFHISDEPSLKDKSSYIKAKNLVEPYIGNSKIIDALSEFSFYEEKIIKNPIVAIDHIQNFIDKGVTPWAYYCCAQMKDVSNRFIAMPSSRTRILGIILYKYNVKGFLQWGYNFYYTALSKRVINPYFVTDADCSFPSGDPFSVYPYNNSVAESIRIKVFYDGLQDMRALYTLEEMIGREKVLEIIKDIAQMDITFTDYPKKQEFIFELRRVINGYL